MLSKIAAVSRVFSRSSRAVLSSHYPLAQIPTRPLSGSTPRHIDTPDNIQSRTPFDFTEENYVYVNKVLSKYPANFRAAGIIPLLDLAQRQAGGWLPLAAMDKVAQVVGVAPMRVYEVATFYTMFNREKRGKYFIQLCGTTPCMICGAGDIKKTITEHLGIEDGETTPDGLFTLLEVECLGACANAPMIQLNDDYYECLTPKTTIELLEACKKGAPPPMGKWGSLPMNGQVSCEGPLGKTCLTTIPAGFVREGGFEGSVDPASVKEHMGY
uniref:NADH dehydrogenase [ubiquinone] flavoprotein 2, mitochondrial n=1 Tax=Corethron hystrix TaxID=216773 RepID=A0A7S1BN60_9STRA|mmetsp:Transcript_34746/g.80319  ORF Transcript_34746/g.80319 Transcript_34746/m.80319 type:complete len:270 (+) Transcript_34746:207-1016(+)